MEKDLIEKLKQYLISLKEILEGRRKAYNFCDKEDLSGSFVPHCLGEMTAYQVALYILDKKFRDWFEMGEK